MELDRAKGILDQDSLNGAKSAPFASIKWRLSVFTDARAGAARRSRREQASYIPIGPPSRNALSAGDQGFGAVPVLLRQFLHGLIKKGSLEVFPSSARPFTVGDGGEPSCAIRFIDRGAEVVLALDPEMAVGELYVDGRLKMIRGEIYDLLALGASNLADGKIGRVAAWQ